MHPKTSHFQHHFKRIFKSVFTEYSFSLHKKYKHEKSMGTRSWPTSPLHLSKENFDIQLAEADIQKNCVVDKLSAKK